MAHLQTPARVGNDGKQVVDSARRENTKQTASTKSALNVIEIIERESHLATVLSIVRSHFIDLELGGKTGEQAASSDVPTQS